MFKSIQWKLVLMFVLLMISVMIIVGTYMLNSTSDFYHESFIEEMDKVFLEHDFRSLDNSFSELSEKIEAFTFQLGIDSYRNYYIFDNKGKLLVSSTDSIGEVEYASANLISALAGYSGKKVNTGLAYVDYAFPVMSDNNEVKYVIYIRDTKEELRVLTSRINEIIIYSVLLGLLISMGLGFLLSNTITTPISVLTKNAEKLAQGDFKERIEVMSKDEIGQLTNTFNIMAAELDNNIALMSSEKNMMEAIFVNMTDGLIAFNSEGRVIHANPAAKNMLGFEDVSKIYFNDYFQSLGMDISLESILYEERWTTKEEELNTNGLNIKAFFVPFLIEEDKAGGVVAVFQDITKQQKLEMARREFVANVSHELRTPLTSIKSYAETLIDGAIDDKNTSIQFLNVINNESDRMTRLVKDLLFLSKLDHMKEQSEMKSFSIVEMINSIIEKLSITAKKHKHQLAVNIEDNIPEIYGNKDRVEQVIINILSNAIKYTPDGGNISVSAHRKQDNVEIIVKDNGIGIPSEDLNRIFERFYRVDKARSRSLGGTGLGLAIAKEIIDAHNGNIEINSESDEGTEVIITLKTISDKL